MATPKKTPRPGRHPADHLQKQTVAEVAVNENVSEATVRRWIARGELRAYRYGPRLLRIDPADVERMRSQVAAPTYRSRHDGRVSETGGDQA